ncbi:glycerophosphodiester phosphodiesterase [Pedobacter yulinensis]|uniref:Glycerophosphodiester phosphodiesterase n=1 Tax=Pedobacter yulinensis TaxID=2126353 RepID=A0A2T3HI09_9SPHI|nr:glycerophosphodiester phosphodiesterase family protein [Pedobacter yulinensis]PST82078.1 glycerophosphodiester phosphodiesterase [Pedobacter yulinensis]
MKTKPAALTLLLFQALWVQAQYKMDIQGHRGCRGLMPENSIPAMYHAIDLGTPTLEFDCVISQDQAVVVSHDPFMAAAFMLKPDGSAISKAESRKLLLYQMRYDSIRKYDGGMKPHADFPDQKKTPVYRPLLGDLLDSVERYCRVNRRRPVRYSIEIKTTPGADGISQPEPETFVRLVMAQIVRRGLQKRVTIQSYDARILQVLHHTYPRQEVAYLIRKGEEDYAANLAFLGFKPAYVSISSATVSPDFVAAAHRDGTRVITGVVNDVPLMEKMLLMGVDGIITDYPDRALKHQADRKKGIRRSTP